MTYGYESGYGSGSSNDVNSSTAPVQYGYESGYGSSPTDSSSNASPQEAYSLKGLASNVLPDIGRNILGLGMQLKQGLYDIPKAAIVSPAQVLQGTPIDQTDLAKYTTQNTQGMAQGIKDFANDPIGAMYRNPVTTALTASAIGSKALPLAQTAGIKTMSAALGPSSDAIEARMADPSGIKDASSYSELAYQLPKTLKELQKQIEDHTDNAASNLRDSNNLADGAVPKNQINSMLGELIAGLKIKGALVGDAKKLAAEKIQSVANDIQQIGSENPNLTEMDLKHVIQTVGKNVDWTDKSLSDSNSALTDFRGQLDEILKGQNPQYKEAMKPAAQKVSLLEKLKDAFNITQKTGEGLQPTDTTISKLQSLPTERKTVTQKLINRLTDATGVDYLQKSKNYGISKQFEGGSPNGARRVASFGGMGTAIGAGIGHYFNAPTAGALTGEALGSAAGLLADKYGGPIAGAMADTYRPLNQAVNRLVSSAPVQSLSPLAIQALLSKYYSQNADQKRNSP